jgi:type II secretory pathway predicted ATPase ExeA
MDYLKFFELSREPFRNDPDPDFFFESGTARRARLRLERAIEQRKGLAVVIGPAGCGKTTLAAQIAWGLDPTRFRAEPLVVSHRSCAQGGLLPEIAERFGVRRVAAGPADQIAQIGDAMLRVWVESRHPVLIVDEAQLLATPDVMRELRGLLNLSHSGRRLLTMVLVGLPELDGLLRADESLAQRVEVRVDLTPLRAEEVSDYVSHRLAVAKARRPLFDAEAVGALSLLAGGVPRVINTLADNALFEAYLSEVEEVDVSLVHAAAEQLALPPPLPSTVPAAGVHARLAAAPAVEALQDPHHIEALETLEALEPLEGDGQDTMPVHEAPDSPGEVELTSPVHEEAPPADLDHTEDSAFDLSSLVDAPDQPAQATGLALVDEDAESAELDDLFAQIQLD